MMEKVSSASVDITEDNIEKLKELFPEILTDGNKIDFEKLQLILGEEVDGEKERYSFNWPGKREAIIGAQQPSKGTLRPNLEKSKNFDTTENLYIEGDNLEVLKLLQKSYNNKIKVIYIDPPYNTGKDFVYKDNFRDGVNNYLEQTGQVDSEGNLLSTNSESNGRFHTDWLNMMYPRLKLARNLLTDDGVLIASIDDAEVVNLGKVCEEIFGEKNVEIMIWNKEAEGSSGTLKATKRIRRVHEYMVFCYKDKGNLQFHKINEALKGRENELQTANLAVNEDNEKTTHKNYFTITNPKDIKFTRQWKWSKEDVDKLIAQDLIYWGSDGMKQPRLIIPTDERRTTYLQSIFNYGGTTVGRKDFEKLMGDKIEFSYPKPIVLLMKILSTILGKKESNLVLDFFAGSSSSAQTVLEINAKHNLTNKFIMVQLPEELEEASYGFKNGYKNICDIGIERINRAGEKIVADNPGNSKYLDIGFKYLSLDKTNIREWNTDFDNIENELDLFSDVFVEGRSELDIVYEIMLKNGLELTLPVDTFEVNGNKIYDIAFGHQFICLSDEIDTNVAKAIIEKHNEYGTEITSGVVFKDSGFNGNDSEKLNCIQLLKDAGFIEANLQTI